MMKKQLAKRMLAFMLAIGMIFGLIPNSVYVSADNSRSTISAPTFMVTVRDLAGVKITYEVTGTTTTIENGESKENKFTVIPFGTEEVTTDAYGKANLPELANKQSKMTLANTVYTITIQATKEGYYDVKESYVITSTTTSLSLSKQMEKSYYIKVSGKGGPEELVAGATIVYTVYTQTAEQLAKKEKTEIVRRAEAQTDANGIATLSALQGVTINGTDSYIDYTITKSKYQDKEVTRQSISGSPTKIEAELVYDYVKVEIEAANDEFSKANIDSVTMSPSSKEIQKNTDATIGLSISADDKVITSVKINSGNELLTGTALDYGTKSCQIEIPAKNVTKNQKIEVTLASAYTVTVERSDENGTLISTPDCSGGSVRIKNGGKVFVSATPEKHYRLASIETYNKDSTTLLSKKEFTQNNYSVTNKEFTITKDTKIKFVFAKNNYTVTVKTSGKIDDNCGVKFDNNSKTYNGVAGDKPILHIKQSDAYFVDSITETIDGGNSKNLTTPLTSTDKEFDIEIPELTGNAVITVNYAKIEIIAPAENQMSLTDNYNIEASVIRDIVQSEYQIKVVKKDTQVKINATKKDVTGCDVNTESQYEKTSKTLPKNENENFIINAIKMIKKELGSTKNMYRVEPLHLAFVYDLQTPVVKLSDADTKTKYKGDVELALNVDEPDSNVKDESTDQKLPLNDPVYSGIKTVKYWITVGNEPQTEENAKILYSCANNELKGSLADKIVVKASEFNCDDIKVTVVAEDFAGNVSRPETRTLNIDASAPQVSLTYDNNNNYKDSKYFNKPRTATLVIKERSDFDLDAAKGAIKIEAKDVKGNAVEGAYAISDWTVAKNVQNDNDTTYTAKISFNEDANYKLSMQFTDAAGNLNDEIDTGKSVAPYEFTVDTTAPSAEVKAKSSEGRASKWEGLVTDARFSYFSKKGITISGTATDLTSPILSTEYYKQTRKTGEAALKAMTVAELNAIKDWKKLEDFSVKSDEEFIVYIKSVDAAGNCTYISTDGLIVDKNSPRKETLAPKVTAKPAQPVNGFYSKDVVVNLKVEDPDVNGAYTGLKEVTYKVYNMSESDKTPTQQGTLYSYDGKKTAKTDLIKDYAGKITIDSTKNNSNQVKVVIYAEDNAGNGQTEELKLKIDTTAPKVDIRYANNDEASDKYFNADRTATITVTERNFDKKDMDIEITNSDGKAPTVSAWTKKKGAGNGDDTKWVATVKYEKDGDYTFDIHYKDRAGNKAKINYAEDTVAAKEFTIDKTNPKIEVSYDSNNAHNGEYYNTARRATVTITEHNFDPERVDAGITAVENGQNVGAPEISGWTNNGDVHTATISYAKDAKYTFNISAIDMAGNEAENFAEQSFYVDQTEPVLEINGVEDLSANAGDVIPVVTYSDDNFDANALNIKLTGANRKEVQLDGSYANTATGGTFTFKNFAKTQDVDDIYTLSATMTDKAGNEVSKEITFSVNRFGSTYDFNDQTDSMNGNFVQAADDVVVVETNPTPLSDIKVTLFQNNETTVLAEGTDYDLSTTGGNGQWYHYTYTVHKSVFEKDGVYKLVLHSKDGAENISENILESKDAEISFGVDKTAPNIVVANLESKKTYAVDNMTVIMSANDNLKLTDVTVYLDNKIEKEWKDSALEEMIDQDGDLQFDIPGTSNKAHTVKIVCHDAAGNEAVQEITGFYVTTNIWVRYFNNKPLFYGSICGVIVVLGAGVFFVLRRRKKATK